MMCIARLVRVLLGETAISARKLEFGPSLTILGVSVSIICGHLFMGMFSFGALTRFGHQAGASALRLVGKRRING